MGIAHLEDLSTADFLSTVEQIGLLQATEKLDGANLYFGIDAETDKLFTSREGKRASAKRYFSANDYPYFGGTNPFRAAHIALQNEEQRIREVLQAGQTVEVEVLFGRQPNAITYGAGDKSFIAFLRGVEGTKNDVVDRLTATMLGHSTTVKTEVVASADGANLDLGEVETTFEFIGPQVVDMKGMRSDPDLQKLIRDFNDFLNTEVEGLPESMAGTTNGELEAMSLSGVKVADRPQVKPIKEALKIEIQSKFKLPIKKFLLGQLKDVKSKLTTDKLDHSEDLGIEGIVLRDPTSGDLVKLVDKTAFTAINSFNHTVRGQISGTVRTIDDAAPLESRGGIVGHMKIQIAKALGMPELARAGQAKKILAGFDADGDPVETIKDFANSLAINDFQGKKRFIGAVVSQALKDLNQLRDEFKENKDEYSLKLPNGKIIGISPEVERRTLLSFAEAQVDMVELLEKVKSSTSLAALIALLYGHAVPKNKEEVADIMEAVRKKPGSNSMRDDNDKKKFANKDAWALMNNYFSTVFLSALMYKANDKIGLRMLRDKTNFRMGGLKPDMSPLNFWGYPIWKAGTEPVKKLIGPKAAREINKVVRRVPQAWWKFMHMDLSFGRDVPINWGDHFRTMQMLQQFPGMKFERINFILKGIFNYENLTYDQKIKVLNSLHLYVSQFQPNSPLFARLKDVQRNLLFNPNNEDAIMTLTELYAPPAKRKLKSAHHATNETVDASVVGTDAAAPLSGPLFGGSHKPNVVKRKRNPEIKYVAFKKPENSTV